MCEKVFEKPHFFNMLRLLFYFDTFPVRVARRSIAQTIARRLKQFLSYWTPSNSKGSECFVASPARKSYFRAKTSDYAPPHVATYTLHVGALKRHDRAWQASTFTEERKWRDHVDHGVQLCGFLSCTFRSKRGWTGCGSLSETTVVGLDWFEI